METRNSPIPKKRVLIVDDDGNFARMLGLTLRQLAGYDTRAEDQAPRALASARQFRPDVILLDVCMPGMDGGEVASRLAGDEATRRIPVLFLTSLVDGEEAPFGGLSSGGRRFLPKPGSVVEITHCIEDACSARP
jgi:CheY-like chemotaxis protein